VRKGEIWDAADGEDTPSYLVLIVSDDEWNLGVAPQCLEIVWSHGAREIPPFLLLIGGAAGTVTGLAVMDSLAPIGPSNLVESVGSIGGNILTELDSALKKVFAL
jgi:hypothetical protein